MTRGVALPLAVSVALAALSPAVARADVVDAIDLPPEGASLNRTHVQFRWDAFYHDLHRAGVPYEGFILEVVEDDGSSDPFGGASPPAQHPAAGAEPRTIVKSGLEFDRDYAWRVRITPGDAVSATRRFGVDPLSDLVPALTLTVPPGAAPVQPGLTCWAMRPASVDEGFILCVDEAGELVFQFRFPGKGIGDMRRMDNGRLIFLTQGADSLGQLCRDAYVTTIDSRITWSAPDLCDQPKPFPQYGPHHEVFPMPRRSPRGANYMLLEFDNHLLTFTDIHDGVTYTDHRFFFDAVHEYDRHTNEIVKSWSSFDAVCLDDHLPPGHPSGWGEHPPQPDIHHGNAVIYDADNDRIAVSLRRISRIVVVDWESGETLFQFGEMDALPGGGNPFPCGDVDFGDNLFSAEHAPQFLPNGNMMIYDNGNFLEPLSATRQTRALEIAFDDPLAPTDAWIVQEYGLVSYDLATPAFADLVGDADRMPNGNTLTNDGRQANIMEADPAGNTIWFLDAGVGWPAMGAGQLIYRVEKLTELIVDTPADFDGDQDLDLVDLGALQAAYGRSGPLEYPGTLSDHDRDGDLDARDVGEFAYWMTGPGR